jgi:hypothetical protein
VVPTYALAEPKAQQQPDKIGETDIGIRTSAEDALH